MKKAHTCQTCGGYPHVSGKPCICGDTGRIEDEVQAFRELCFQLQQEIEKLTIELQKLKVNSY